MNEFKGQQLARTREILRRFQAPRYTTTERDALNAEEGMLILNTTTNKAQMYINGTWTDLN
jgi:hypothetical protein